ncbi:hypothetical protein D3C71_1547320 [compost metagenome]
MGASTNRGVDETLDGHIEVSLARQRFAVIVNCGDYLEIAKVVGGHRPLRIETGVRRSETAVLLDGACVLGVLHLGGAFVPVIYGPRCAKCTNTNVVIRSWFPVSSVQEAYCLKLRGNLSDRTAIATHPGDSLFRLYANTVKL